MREYVLLLKGGKKRFGKQEITLRSNYEMLMLYTFFGHTVCVPLKLNLVKTIQYALLSERLVLQALLRSETEIDNVEPVF